MNQRQRNFITKKLIPFILRAEGNGFAMETWKRKYGKVDAQEIRQNEKVGIYDLEFDGVYHALPICNTVACIGGSIQCLTNKKSVRSIAPLLGLTREQTSGLFYNWETEEDSTGFGWPVEFADRFREADSPLAKAKVAVALLKEVVRTEGKCLELGGGEL